MYTVELVFDGILLHVVYLYGVAYTNQNVKILTRVGL